MKSPGSTKRLFVWLALVTATAGGVIGSAWAQSKGALAPAPYPIDRTVLPIAEPKYPLATELDARNATAPKRFEVTAPKGAPNVV